MGAFYSLSKNTFHTLFKIFWRVEIQGKQNIPQKGPLIFAPNHRSYADPPLVGSSCPSEIHFLAKKELFRFKPFGFMITNLNAHRLDRSGPKEGLKTMVGLLSQGKRVLVFPEGRRMKSDKLGPAKAGVGLLAMKTKTPVIPVYVHNSGHLKKLKKLFVVFGKPIQPKAHKTYQSLADQVLDDIAKMKSAFEK